MLPRLSLPASDLPGFARVEWLGEIVVGAEFQADDPVDVVATRSEHDHRHVARAPELLEHLARRMDLDETQTQNIRNIVDAAAPEIEAMRERMHENRKAIRDLDIDDPNHDAELQRLADDNGYLAAEATRLFGRLRADIHAQLTPEQRVETKERMGRMHRRFGAWRHNDREQDEQ